MRAWTFEGSDERSTRGPEDVHIVVERDGAPLLESSYVVAYERDEDFYGNERCGFCDLLESRTAAWPAD